MAHDPKYSFPGGIYHNTGGYVLPADEPMILFRGKDVFTLAAIGAYIETLERQVPVTPTMAEHIVTARERLETIAQWQSDNPNRVGVGCTLERVE